MEPELDVFVLVDVSIERQTHSGLTFSGSAHVSAAEGEVIVVMAIQQRARCGKFDQSADEDERTSV